MQDLIEKLKSQAGLTDEQAIKSMDIIKDHIMSLLPPMMHPMVENFIGQTNANTDDILDN